jgi:hypothetical protein
LPSSQSYFERVPTTGMRARLERMLPVACVIMSEGSLPAMAPKSLSVVVVWLAWLIPAHPATLKRAMVAMTTTAVQSIRVVHGRRRLSAPICPGVAQVVISAAHPPEEDDLAVYFVVDHGMAISGVGSLTLRVHGGPSVRDGSTNAMSGSSQTHIEVPLFSWTPYCPW